MNKLIIKEDILQQIEEDYPQSWDAEEFKSLTSFNARKKYAEEHLTKINSGSSRIVYKIDDEKVLKLAKNKKGIAQYEVEISLNEDYYLASMDILAPLYSYDEDSALWVEMALAKKFTASMAKKYIGLSFRDFQEFLNWSVSLFDSRRYYDESKVEKFEEIVYENPDDYEFASSMHEYVINYQPIIGDLLRTSTYGVVKINSEDEIRIIDYGLNKDVYDSYYS